VEIVYGARPRKGVEEGALTQSRASLVGMIKPSDKSGHVSSRSLVAMRGRSASEMIESADIIGRRACRDHYTQR
jgi:hypothetical protein